MNGETKFMVCVYCLFAVCFTIVYCVLFYALWEYRVYVGFSLLGVVLLLAAVYAKGKLNEQSIRQQRFKHHEETPLDEAGEPIYWHPGIQQNPHRNQYQQQEQYHGYRQQ